MKKILICTILALFLINCDTTNSIYTPYISLSGDDTLTIINPTSYNEPGYSCIDTEDGDLKSSVHVLWLHSDKITPFILDSVKQDSAAFIRYSIIDSDGLEHERWRFIKFTGPFEDDLPWITLTDTAEAVCVNSDFYKEIGFSCLGTGNLDLTDSVVITWYKKDKITPYNADSAKIDSSAYIKYTIKENDTLTDEKWRFVTFTGPFPDAIYTPDPSTYTGCIKPNNITQAQMDETVLAFYNHWKGYYVRASTTTPDGYYIYSGGGTGATDNAVTVSEAQGFGMVITALMGQKDSAAQNIFDGMFKFYKAHPCITNPLLMAWEVLVDSTGKELSSEEAGSYSNSSATDGDIDIAYGLLLAHTIWGSDGDINYLKEADTLINYAIRGDEVGEDTKRPLLGSWDTQEAYKTRPSDWMTGEFHAFAELTGESYWNDVVDTIYAVADHIIDNYSPYTALVPDFVVEKSPKPAPPKFLEWKYDGEYYNNACRVPMRIMTDVAHYQDTYAIEWMMKVAHWITTKSNGDPEQIMGGYFILSGQQIRDWSFPAFISPFIVAASISPEYQEFVNLGWELIHDWTSNYYNDCINLMCLLQLSGNWFKPEL